MESSDFNLTNADIDTWEKAQFWELDPMQNNQNLCKICLWVNWEDKIVTIETVMNDNSVPGELWHGLCSRYKMADDTDFTEFAGFFSREIQPMLQKLGEGYKSEHDGHNWKGHLNDGELVFEISEKLETAPKHDMIYFIGLLDLYGSVRIIVRELKDVGIDIYTADFNDDEVVKKATEALTSFDGIDYKLLNTDVQEELKTLQKELNEEYNEE
jgi:hypothetical protein